MAVGIVVGIVFAVFFVAACILAFKGFNDCNNVLGTIGVVLALALAIGFILVPFSFHSIDTGEIAVVKRFGEITDVKGPGLNYDLWVVTKYEKYDTKVQNVDVATMAYSSDAQTMDVAMTFQYQIITDKVTDIATVYGSLDALQARIQSIVIEQTKSVLSSYKAMDIIANRASISPAVEQAIIDAVTDEYYVNIVTVALTNIDFSDAFEQAVEDKMIAEQAKLKADYENQTKVAKAEADAAAKLAAAQAEIEIAKAEAEAKKIAAEAEAEANRIVADSLTDIILEKIYAENWNGELPDVVGSGDYILPSDIFQTEK
jgi:regulator of protease activity HflC (stomatin/prohibitin superfamily)